MPKTSCMIVGSTERRSTSPPPGETGGIHHSHLIINVEGDETATCRSYFRVFQSRPDLPLQAIITGRYHDELEQSDGTWRFKKRTIFPDLIGDLSKHLLFDQSEIARGNAEYIN